MQMVLRTLSVGELRSPNSTPRHHSKKQRAKARALFAEQGIVVPIIVDDRMRIIDGVLRFETAKELGLDRGHYTVNLQRNYEKYVTEL